MSNDLKSTWTYFLKVDLYTFESQYTISVHHIDRISNIIFKGDHKDARPPYYCITVLFDFG